MGFPLSFRWNASIKLCQSFSRTLKRQVATSCPPSAGPWCHGWAWPRSTARSPVLGMAPVGPATSTCGPWATQGGSCVQFGACSSSAPSRHSAAEPGSVSGTRVHTQLPSPAHWPCRWVFVLGDYCADNTLTRLQQDTAYAPRDVLVKEIVWRRAWGDRRTLF